MEFVVAFCIGVETILLTGSRVVVKSEVSDWLTVTSGVSQGSQLGPLFFIIYIKYLTVVISKDSSFALYLLYRIINAPEGISSFQGDLERISTGA